MKSSELWTQLGISIVNWADQNFLLGVGKLTSDIYKTISSINKKSPLDWNCKFHELYKNESSVLWIKDESGIRSFLPQVVLISPRNNLEEFDIKIELISSDFKASCPVKEAFDYYKRIANRDQSKILFDGTNARLADLNKKNKKLYFQGTSFFDYLQTNLALDFPLPVLGSLRQQITKDGRLEHLNKSKLANSACVNGLLFSNDGHLIFQKRSNNVVIRPGELCSGFSGTLDKADIEHAIAKGDNLSNIDILREMEEEVGIKRYEVSERRFLGLTRELIRGGAPEFFYSIKVDLSLENIRSRLPKDKEGMVKDFYIGHYVSYTKNSSDIKYVQSHFWQFIREIHKKGKGPISIPFLTNLVLWYHQFSSKNVGTSKMNK